MVKLTKIYTRTGDDGSTGLGTRARVAKDSLRVEAYGEVDEANAALGLAVEACESGGQGEIAGLLRGMQQDLFDVGADLCVPVEPGEKSGSKLRVQAAQTQRLEKIIDRFNDPMPSLMSFILPGGSGAAAALHLARTVVRRAERRVVQLLREEGKTTNGETVKYLNRLSDLLFVLSRAVNGNGAKDVLWVPGANREK